MRGRRRREKAERKMKRESRKKGERIRIHYKPYGKSRRDEGREIKRKGENGRLGKERGKEGKRKEKSLRPINKQTQKRQQHINEK